MHCRFSSNKTSDDERLDIKSMQQMLDGLKYSNNTPFQLSWYNSDIKENYFKYRLLSMKKIDYGIIDADRLYSGLVENYHKQYRSNLLEGNFNDLKNERGRHFCSEQFLIFTDICNCIAAHNVYMATKDSRNDYINYKLNDLLPENFKKISYKSDPLLFILCVADTLEPTKKFKNIPVKKVINNISIDYDDKENSVVVHIYERLKNVCDSEIEKYIENVEELEKWCDIKARVVVH